MAARLCLVGFWNADRVFQAVEVEAESLFEAAVRGWVALRSCPSMSAAISSSTVLDVLAMPGGRVGRVRIDRLLRWLDSAGRSPKDQVRRYQLKRLLTGEPHGRRRERYH